MKLSELIHQYREQNGISQRELARRCGLSNSLISLMEMGINPQTGKEMAPDLATYRKLAEGMGTTVQSLFERLDHGVFVSVNDDTAGNESFDELIPGTELDHYLKALGLDRLTQEDQQRLEALHQDPRLGLLFDRTRKMSSSDVDTMLAVAASILRERDGE